jgi:hypothetical protein
MKQTLGTFKVKSNSVIVSDPCYESPSLGNVRLNDVATGQWVANIKQGKYKEWGNRVFVLEAHLENIIEKVKYHRLSVGIAVDSGQVCIADTKYFKAKKLDRGYKYKTEVTKWEDFKREFYTMCSDITLDRDAGVFSSGVVSSSGIGDGSYPCYVATATKNGKFGTIVGIKVVFLRGYK